MGVADRTSAATGVPALPVRLVRVQSGAAGRRASPPSAFAGQAWKLPGPTLPRGHDWQSAAYPLVDEPVTPTSLTSGRNAVRADAPPEHTEGPEDALAQPTETTPALLPDVDTEPQAVRMAASADPLDDAEGLRMAMHCARQAAWHWEPATGRESLSTGFLELFGHPAPAERSNDARLLSLVHPDDAAAVGEWWRALEADGHEQNEIEYRIRGAGGDDEWHWIVSRGQAARRDAQGRPACISGMHTDITQRRRFDADIRQLAYFDALTGLANRAMLQEKLAQLIGAAERTHERLALLFIDLDNFKMVNDSLGHEAGDMLLRGVAERLRQHVRAEDVIARLGGDEFVIVLTQLSQDDLPARAARRLIEALTPPFVLHGQEINVSPSIGISVFPTDGRDSATLLKNADTAMYRVKEAGRNSYRFFTAAMNASVVREARIESRLRHAMNTDGLRLQYQPQVDARSRRIVGAEALLRWNDDELGPLAPLRFVPIAERTALIGPLGDWVLQTACTQARRWIESGFAPVPVSVNVSPVQFNDFEFVPRLRAIVTETGLEPSLLQLEFSEATLMKDAEQSVATLSNLRSMGVRLAVDGFGTGYSSLAWLRRFPIDKLKIDRSFIMEIPDSREAVEIAAAVVDIGNRLRLLVSAEGVETEAQAAFMQKLGCAELQGFHFEAAIDPDRFEAMLRAERARREGSGPAAAPAARGTGAA